jgi:hypothetical protein
VQRCCRLRRISVAVEQAAPLPAVVLLPLLLRRCPPAARAGAGLLPAPAHLWNGRAGSAGASVARAGPLHCGLACGAAARRSVLKRLLAPGAMVRASVAVAAVAALAAGAAGQSATLAGIDV